MSLDFLSVSCDIELIVATTLCKRYEIHRIYQNYMLHETICFLCSYSLRTKIIVRNQL